MSNINTFKLLNRKGFEAFPNMTKIATQIDKWHFYHDFCRMTCFEVCIHVMKDENDSCYTTQNWKITIGQSTAIVIGLCSLLMVTVMEA